MGLRIANLTVQYNKSIAVDNITLTVKTGELLALLGPSGCGKTTLLKSVAGLIPQTSGSIFLKQAEISSWRPQKRNTALVFQNYALFPHLNVEENIAYGLRTRKLSSTLITKKIDQVVEIVRLKQYQHRQVHQLSGGQQQRVALARALVLEPDVLLFDEPLSNLDEKLRVSMRQEIRRIQKELQITSIYVTHDQEEALAIADRIAIMNNGRIEQIETPDNIYHYPTNTFVADFIGSANIFRAEVVKKDANYLEVALLGKRIGRKVSAKGIHSKATCLLRPEEISIVSQAGLPAKIVWVENLGNIKRYTVKLLTGGNVIVDILNSRNKAPYVLNQDIFIDFSADAVQLIDLN